MQPKEYKSMDKPVNKYVAAGVIVLFTLIFIGILYWNYDSSETGFTYRTIFIPALFLIVAGGFTLLALDKKGKHITTEETDKKISKKIMNMYLIIIVLVTIVMVWRAYGDA